MSVVFMSYVTLNVLCVYVVWDAHCCIKICQKVDCVYNIVRVCFFRQCSTCVCSSHVFFFCIYMCFIVLFVLLCVACVLQWCVRSLATTCAPYNVCVYICCLCECVCSAFVLFSVGLLCVCVVSRCVCHHDVPDNCTYVLCLFVSYVCVRFVSMDVSCLL